MAYKEVSRVDIVEVIRRWQKGNSQRHIASGTGLSRDTVRKYLAAAEEVGVSREGPDPSEEQLSRLVALSRSGPRKKVTPAEDLLEPWGDQIYRWVTVDRLQVTRIGELLAQRGCQVSYTSLRRFLQRRNWRRRSARTVRMEQSGPGEVAELDFGRLGFIQDQEAGRRCTVWALIVVLTHSRHSFLWPTYSQKLEEVIAGLEAAWAFFGGIPKYLVIDNFPAAVAGADALHPRLTRGFLEYSQHRGFITDPARVRHPKDKPKVERGVQYVRERFFKGGEFKDLGHLRYEAARWCLDVAGRRIHGTIRSQPLQVFLEEERQALHPWDGEPYEVTHWRNAKVHPDHHVACQYALYSVPAALCPPGQQVEIGLGVIRKPDVPSGRSERCQEFPGAPGGLPGVGAQFLCRQVAVVEVLVQLVAGAEIAAPSVAAYCGVHVLGDHGEGTVAVVGQALVLGDDDQAMGEGAPQEFGGNYIVAAVLRFLAGPGHEVPGRDYVFFLVHGLIRLASWRASWIAEAAKLKPFSSASCRLSQ